MPEATNSEVHIRQITGIGTGGLRGRNKRRNRHAEG